MIRKNKEKISEPKVFEGVNVLDFSGVIAGSYCTRMLSDLGAEVLKIEHPKGEIMRRVAPMRGKASAVFGALNMGKKNIALDLKREEAVSICKQLLKKYDVIVENYSPGVMSRLGLGYDQLKEINPQLIMCSISGYGQNGPSSQKPAFAPIVQAASGFDLTYLQTQPDLAKPLNMGPPVGDTTASLQAFGAISAALYYRSKTGIGQHIDIAMMDCLIASMHRDFQSALQGDEVDRRYGPIATKDGFIVVIPLTQVQFTRLVKCIGRAELLENDRFSSEKERFENYNELMEITEKWSKKLDSKTAIEALEDAKIPCAEYRTLKESANDPQLDFRKFIIKIEDEIGSYEVTDTPIRFSNTSTANKLFVAEIGEHSISTLEKDLRMRKVDIQTLIDQEVVFQA